MDYLALLKAPPKAARGWTRWWWYGCNVERWEIDRELDFMRDSGIGGVELQILYPLEPDDPRSGSRNIPFGAPEFFDILAYTQSACAKRGMSLDITPGSSWPFGGPVITDEDAQQEAIPYQYDITGPSDFSCDFTTRFAGNVCAAAMGRMEHSVMVPESVVDITGHFKEKLLFGWPWGTELETIHVPEGDWKLVFFVISMHRNRVGKPGRNAEGRVIDHCSRRAMEVFLANMVRPIAERVQDVHGWFCDSIEVEGHNWSGVLLDEFRRRRGYDLSRYIYALWGQLGDLSPRVRYDYFRTMGELTLENFFDVLTDFAHAHGALSRIQAHGTWADILRAYAAADIPEGETFGDHRALEVNTIHRRLAASAGHVYGRPIISNETFTWLKRPRFTETLREMKAAVDAVFCDGVNMIVNHGYAYSPERAEKRGWPFYASTHINHTTPWWPFYHHLADYITRVSAMLRRGRPCAEVAVYLPTADIYAENMLSELHLAMRMEEHLGRARMDAIQKAGYGFDYVNDEALTTLGEMRDGGLWIGGNRYRAILLIGCTRLPVETARALERFAACGGLLIAEKVPDDGCGLMDYERKREAVRAAMEAAFAYENAVVAPDALEALKLRLEPEVRVAEPEHTGWVHRVDGRDHIYFVANITDEEMLSEVTLTFRDRTEPFRVYETVPRGAEPTECNYEWRWVDGKLRLQVFLERQESCFVVFSPDFEDRTAGAAEGVHYGSGLPARLPDRIRDLEIQALEDWRLVIPERGLVYRLEEPVSWETLPGLEDFSGEGVYACTFSLEKRPGASLLMLDCLSCACKVIVNGHDAGDIWTDPLEKEITPFLRVGENTLELKVASTLINEMRAADPERGQTQPAVLEHWPYYGKIIDDIRRVRLNTRMEREEQTEPLRSGIWKHDQFSLGGAVEVVNYYWTEP